MDELALSFNDVEVRTYNNIMSIPLMARDIFCFSRSFIFTNLSLF